MSVNVINFETRKSNRVPQRESIEVRRLSYHWNYFGKCRLSYQRNSPQQSQFSYLELQEMLI